jgi:hypothetical protein
MDQEEERGIESSKPEEPKKEFIPSEGLTTEGVNHPVI